MGGRSQDVRVFDEIPEQGITRYFVMDHATGTFKIVTEQNVEPLLDAAQENFKNFDERTPWKGDQHMVAKMPMTVLEQCMREQWDQERIKRWVNDPDNRKFRTRPGRV